MAPHSTLSSQQRANVMRAYRYRGHRNRQLYLVYSVKTNRDWIVSSDYRFLHWITYLETNPEVVSFELSDDIVDPDTAGERPNVHALVTTRDSRIVGHRIVPDGCIADQEAARPTSFDSANEVQLIREADLRSGATVAMRWAKVIGFAAVLRDQRLVSETVLVSRTARELETGTVRQIVDAVPDVDDAFVKGLVARLAIAAWLRLDLSRTGYTLDTPWRWEGEA
ncbi:conserved hypothetical protein [Paraburkholderia piptadeniae]|uniref:TnsA endonuclease N-terminal domain-containing protein n=1 Tax=Paraburkholderia piptadeniae TaxID=1701573 RepID=A0A1N7SPT9_9BURK|nr:hypothetical protein [Paraburkholderia piptadeniae]SIT49461.1 conserved hypothetical protein [Paraburkholderia piptadeniae]